MKHWHLRTPPRPIDPLKDLNAAQRWLLDCAADSLIVLTAGLYRPMGRPTKTFSPQIVAALVERKLLERFDSQAARITREGRALVPLIRQRRATREALERQQLIRDPRP